LNADSKPELPFFLILDEMNLSHVERYFADFLSAMESGDAIPLHSDDKGMEASDGTIIPYEIEIPSNLFIIGTVNIDETTNMFSPKVMDRANVIEFRVTEEDLKEFLDNPVKPKLNEIRGTGAVMASDFLRIAREEIIDFEDKSIIKTELLKFFKELKKTGDEFGYRTSSEIFRFACIIEKLTAADGKAWETDEIIDAAVLQKLLPKLHGSRKKLDPVLKTLAVLCLKDGLDNTTALIEGFEKNPETIDNDDNVRFKMSLEKILRMKKRADQDGFTSFAEA
jgi:5-methylcytosine-specific restriction protein B